MKKLISKLLCNSELHIGKDIWYCNKLRNHKGVHAINLLGVGKKLVTWTNLSALTSK